MDDVLRGLRVGFCLTGSFCTLGRAFEQMELLAREGAIITPILSGSVNTMDTRFFTADEVKRRISEITQEPILTTIQQVEPIGPRAMTDLMIVAPCTGNTLAKLAHGMTDSAVTMAAKAHLRNGKPLVIAFSTNDGLSGSAENIARLLNRKNVYFVPFGQDDPAKKPRSLQSDFELIGDTVEAALRGWQLQPILRK